MQRITLATCTATRPDLASSSTRAGTAKYVSYLAMAAKLHIIVAVGGKIVALGYTGNGSQLTTTQGNA